MHGKRRTRGTEMNSSDISKLVDALAERLEPIYLDYVKTEVRQQVHAAKMDILTGEIGQAIRDHVNKAVKNRLRVSVEVE